MKPVAGTENAPATLLHVARLASSAGAQVLARRGSGPLAAGPDTKSAAGDWVTDFDRGAERSVREFLAMARPADELTGEEYPASGTGTSGYRWSIDPLDGTANFVRGIVYYATSVALWGPDEDGGEAWLAGAVTAPALGVQYFAGRGLGAHRVPWAPAGVPALGSETAAAPAGAPDTNSTGSNSMGAEHAGALRLAGPNLDSSAPVLATGFGYDPADRAVQMEALSSLHTDFANVRRLGSAALDLCLVAEGALDAYVESGTHEWDWAAGALICEEAGVPVTRPHRSGEWQAAGALGVGHVQGLAVPPGVRAREAGSR